MKSNKFGVKQELILGIDAERIVRRAADSKKTVSKVNIFITIEFCIILIPVQYLASKVHARCSESYFNFLKNGTICNRIKK